MAAAIEGPAHTLLELGAGAGNNAVHLKRHFECTLADIAPRMLDLSRELNPGCEHVLGDMRTLRLGRQFDAVLVHDAIVNMVTEADLVAAIRTAYAHTRSGGAALFAPDEYADDFAESTVMAKRNDYTCVERPIDDAGNTDSVWLCARPG